MNMPYNEPDNWSSEISVVSIPMFLKSVAQGPLELGVFHPTVRARNHMGHCSARHCSLLEVNMGQVTVCDIK